MKPSSGWRALLLLAICVSGCGRPQTFSRVESPRCSSVALRVEGDLPLVEVTAAGASLDVVVDTGSVQSITVLPEDIQRLGLAFDDRRRSVRDARGNPLEVRGVTIPMLRLGGTTFHDVAGWEAVHDPQWQPPVRAGHVGRGLLSTFRSTVDVPKGRLHLDRASCPRPDHAVALRADFSSNGVVTAADLDGDAIELIWDSAATTSILDEGAAGSHKTFERDGQRFLSPRSLTIAGHLVDLELAVLALGGIPADGLVGMNFFRERAVTFDFDDSLLLIGPRG